MFINCYIETKDKEYVNSDDMISEEEDEIDSEVKYNSSSMFISQFIKYFLVQPCLYLISLSNCRIIPTKSGQISRETTQIDAGVAVEILLQTSDLKCTTKTGTRTETCTTKTGTNTDIKRQ